MFFHSVNAVITRLVRPTSPRFSPAFSFLCWEAAFAMAFETWFGPIYLSGLAGELGASVGLVAFLTALPWVGYTGQILGLWLSRNFSSARKYTLIAATLGRSLWLIPLFLAASGLLSRDRWIFWTAIVAGVSSICSSSGTVSWMSWMKGIVPDRYKGRFWGKRQKFTMAGVVLANAAGVFLCAYRPHGNFAGFGVLAVLGLTAGWVSVMLLSRVHESLSTQRLASAYGHPSKKIHPVVNAPSFFESLLEPLRDRNFRVALLVWPLFNATVVFVGPFFPYYFTHELKLPMSYVSGWSMISNLGSVFASVYWGRKIDQHGTPLKVLLITGLIFAASPLFYLSSSPEWIRWIAPPEHFVNGVAWTGINIAIYTLVFKVCPPGRSETYFSVYFAITGLTSAAAIYLGGVLATLLQSKLNHLGSGAGFRALWVIGSVARASVVVLLVRFARRELYGKRISV